MAKDTSQANVILTLGGVDEVWGDVTTVKLHALNDLQLIVQSLSILKQKALTHYNILYLQV